VVDDMEKGPLAPVEKIVQHLQLEAVTMEGWEVVESLSYDGVIEYVEQVPPDPMASGYQPPRYINRTQVGRLVGFRVRKKADAVLATLNQRISALQAANDASGKNAQTALGGLEKETKAHEATKAKLREWETSLSQLEEKLKSLEATTTESNSVRIALEKELKDFERVKRVFGLRAISEALMKSDAVDVLEEASPKEES